MHLIRGQLPGVLRAIHVNHGLHASAGRWQRHCERFCAERAIPIEVRSVAVVRGAASGPEAEARRLRYDAITQVLAPSEYFLTAHHADDQAETLLLNLLLVNKPAEIKFKIFHNKVFFPLVVIVKVQKAVHVEVSF